MAPSTLFLWMPQVRGLLVLLVLLVNCQRGSCSCTMCADGVSSIDPNGMIGGFKCSELDQYIGSTPETSAECIQVRLQSFLDCGCPTYPNNYFCSLCEESTSGGNDTAAATLAISNPNKRIPFGLLQDMDDDIRTLIQQENERVFYSCEELFFARRTNANEAALDPTFSQLGTVVTDCPIAQRASYVCGCPTTTTPAAVESDNCWTCPTTTAFDVALPFRRRRVPPTFQYTCQDYYAASQIIVTSSPFTTGQNQQESCLRLIEQQSFATTTINVPSYCGCNITVTPPPDPPVLLDCPLCPSGNTALTTSINRDGDAVISLQNSNLDCSALEALSLHVTNPSFCSALQEYASSAAAGCCFSGEDGSGQDDPQDDNSDADGSDSDPGTGDGGQTPTDPNTNTTNDTDGTNQRAESIEPTVSPTLTNGQSLEDDENDNTDKDLDLDEEPSSVASINRTSLSAVVLCVLLFFVSC